MVEVAFGLGECPTELWIDELAAGRLARSDAVERARSHTYLVFR
ncbi:hypothetical protein ABZ897_40130 [Nonomuraea sp. NPDC046802]